MNAAWKWGGVAKTLFILMVGATAAGPAMSNVETPTYAIVETSGDIEIRRYDPMVIAEVEVTGPRDVASGTGFRLLADYIFGNNEITPGVAVVEQQGSVKIAMTAPVQQQAAGDTWRISFVMPSEYRLDTLPRPVNNRVTLKAVPAQTVVAITFSGRNTDSNVHSHESELRRFVERRGLAVTGSPKYAFYNPPWTLPMLRRNEIMLALVP
ncbi:MAG: heme-binding protein [Pseudomonadota bacterium]